MADGTYFVALPFVLDEQGDWVPGEAQDRSTASAAIRLAESLAARYSAAAFSQTSDPATCDFADATVLVRFGEVPSEIIVGAP